MDLLNRAERAAVDEIKAAYDGLSPLGKAEAAQAISFAERHFVLCIGLAFVLGGICGAAWLAL